MYTECCTTSVWRKALAANHECGDLQHFTKEAVHLYQTIALTMQRAADYGAVTQCILNASCVVYLYILLLESAFSSITWCSCAVPRLVYVLTNVGCLYILCLYSAHVVALVSMCSAVLFNKLRVSFTIERRVITFMLSMQDVQALFSADDSTTALSEKILALQNAAGIKTKLVNPRASGVKTVTLTGWAALTGLVSLIAVIAGGLFLGYKRWLSQDVAYAPVSKSGDV